MVEKCVAYACSNSKNKQKGISMHKIPSDSDPRAEVRQSEPGKDFFHMFSAFQAQRLYKTF